VKFLFVFHRFHTNQYFLTKYLIENGHKIKYLVKYKDIAEDYTFVDPVIIPNSKLFWIFYNFLNFIKNGKLHKDLWKAYGIPNPLHLYKEINKFDPNFVIVRDFSFTSILTILLCKIGGFNCVSYSSRPKFKKKNSITSNI